MRIRKDDTVVVISGKDRGKKGKVRVASPSKEQIIVEGINIVKKHAKSQGMRTQAGIIKQEAPLHVSKVRLVCNKCDRPTRVAFRFVGDGEHKKVRMCRLCGEVID